MATVDRERDRLAHEVCNSIGAFIDEQKDPKEMVQNLAQQIDAIPKQDSSWRYSRKHRCSLYHLKTVFRRSWQSRTSNVRLRASLSR